MSTLKCFKCGKEFLKPLGGNAYKLILNGYTKNFCSYSCYRKGGVTVNETLVSVLVEKLRAKKVLEQEIADIKKEIERELPQEGFKNELITISHKAGSETVSIDYEAFEKAEPELYNDLMKDYKKIKITKPSVSYTVKKVKE